MSASLSLFLNNKSGLRFEYTNARTKRAFVLIVEVRFWPGAEIPT